MIPSDISQLEYINMWDIINNPRKLDISQAISQGNASCVRLDRKKIYSPSAGLPRQLGTSQYPRR